MSKSHAIKRLWARAGRSASSLAKRTKVRLLAMISRRTRDHSWDSFPSGDAVQRLQAIMERRKSLEAQLESASRCSLVPDGIAECLLNSAVDELEARRVMLVDIQHQLQACLRKLDALCPPPPKPEPEPRPEPRRRKFTNFRDWLNGAPGLAK